MRVNKKIIKTFLTLGVITSLTNGIVSADWIEEKPTIISTSANIQTNKFILKKKFVLSFYTDLPQENGTYKGRVVDAQGNKLTHGTVACNQLPLGTKIYIDGIPYTVRDRGSSNSLYFGSIRTNYSKESMRIDVFVPRNKNESDSAYLKRVNMMGKPTVDGYIVIDDTILSELNFMCPIVTKEDYLKWLETEEGERSLKFNPYEGVN